MTEYKSPRKRSNLSKIKDEKGHRKEEIGWSTTPESGMTAGKKNTCCGKDPKQCGGVKGQCIRMLMMMLITVADDGDDGH